MKLPKIENLNPKSAKRFNLITSVVVVLSLIAVGAFIFATHAATSVTSAETEKGTVSGNATVVTDATASGGQYIDFKGPSTTSPTPPPPTGGGGTTTANATTPCVSSPAPTQWKHVVVLMFENKTYNNVIGSSQAPWITSMAKACGSYTNWHDTDYTVDGTNDLSHNGGASWHSKPNYATLTDGVPPWISGLTTDQFGFATSSVDNIFNRLNQAGMSFKSYESGPSGQCSTSNFDGAYHDPLRYYSDTKSICNAHDISISQFDTDVSSDSLPAFSIVLPTNDENMHNNTISSGDSWAKSFLTPLFNSAVYQSGNTAVFFLWDENTPIPNVLFAPSIKPGTHPVPPGSVPFSHYSALRTFQDMLNMPSPYIGDSGSAPSLLSYFNGNS